MNYKNITHIYTAKGKKYANTVERINQHGSRYYCTFDITGKDWKEGDQVPDSEFESLRLIASTESPYKKPLKSFKKRVMK
jgi:hypothetical protein